MFKCEFNLCLDGKWFFVIKLFFFIMEWIFFIILRYIFVFDDVNGNFLFIFY